MRTHSNLNILILPSYSPHFKDSGTFFFFFFGAVSGKIWILQNFDVLRRSPENSVGNFRNQIYYVKLCRQTAECFPMVFTSSPEDPGEHCMFSLLFLSAFALPSIFVPCRLLPSLPAESTATTSTIAPLPPVAFNNDNPFLITHDRRECFSRCRQCRLSTVLIVFAHLFIPLLSTTTTLSSSLMTDVSVSRVVLSVVCQLF